MTHQFVTARKAAFLEGLTNNFRSADSVLVYNKSRVPREGVDIFHGLAFSKELAPPSLMGILPVASY